MRFLNHFSILKNQFLGFAGDWCGSRRSREPQGSSDKTRNIPSHTRQTSGTLKTVADNHVIEKQIFLCCCFLLTCFKYYIYVRMQDAMQNTFTVVAIWLQKNPFN